MSALVHRGRYWLPGNYALEFTFDGKSLECEWSPDFPSAREGRRLLPAYRAARDHFLSGLCIGPGSADE